MGSNATVRDFSDLIRVQALAQLLPRGRNGAPIAPSTIWRWRLKGLKGRKLKVVVIAGVSYVRRRDLLAFLQMDELPGAAASVTTPPSVGFAREQEEIERRLKEYGI